MRPVNVSLSCTHLSISFPVHVRPVPSPLLGAPLWPYSLSPDGLYILGRVHLTNRHFPQSLGRPLTGLIRLLKPRPDTGFSWDETTHENFPGSSSHDIPRKEKPSTFLKAEFGDLSRNTKSHEYPYNTDLACS